MIRVFVLYYFIQLSTLVTAQVLAGQAGEGFYHVWCFPSFVLEDTEYMNSTTLFMKSIDLNGDGYGDLTFQSRYWAGYAEYNENIYYYPIRLLQILPSDSIDFISAINYNSWGDMVNSFADALEENDIIDSPDNAYEEASDGSVGLTYNMNNSTVINAWYGETNSFIGFRWLQSSGDTVYGWIHASVPSYSRLVIHEYACQSNVTIDTSLNLDIQNPEKIFFQAGPNPFNEFLELRYDSSRAVERITFHSITGNLEMSILNPDRVISTSKLNDGIYIVTAYFQGGVVMAYKLIKFQID